MRAADTVCCGWPFPMQPSHALSVHGHTLQTGSLPAMSSYAPSRVIVMNGDVDGVVAVPLAQPAAPLKVRIWMSVRRCQGPPKVVPLVSLAGLYAAAVTATGWRHSMADAQASYVELSARQAWFTHTGRMGQHAYALINRPEVPFIRAGIYNIWS